MTTYDPSDAALQLSPPFREISRKETEELRPRLYATKMVIETPLIPAPFPENFGAKVFLKMESLQTGGSFKMRGVMAQMLARNFSKSDRLVTYSGGNYAKSFSLACQHLGLCATCVVPPHTPDGKCFDIEAAGALVIRDKDMISRCHQLISEGYTFLHASDDPDFMTGCGSSASEVVEKCGGSINTVILPCGGGGGSSGVSTVFRDHFGDGVKIVLVEPEQADTMSRSFGAGKPQGISEQRTACVGLAPPHAFPNAFRTLQKLKPEIMTVTEDQIRMATGLLGEWGHHVEPSGAAALAGLLVNKELQQGVVVVYITGQNITAAELDAWLN